MPPQRPKESHRCLALPWFHNLFCLYAFPAPIWVCVRFMWGHTCLRTSVKESYAAVFCVRGAPPPLDGGAFSRFLMHLALALLAFSLKTTPKIKKKKKKKLVKEFWPWHVPNSEELSFKVGPSLCGLQSFVITPIQDSGFIKLELEMSILTQK